MKFEEALKVIQEKTRILTDHAQTAERASRTYTARMELYNIAASAGDEKEMQVNRDMLHTCVDTILDAGAMVAQLQKEIHETAHKAEQPRSF
jgi:hypothetical protein